MNKCRLTSLIRLSHLAPEILGALLAGRHPIELTPTRLLRLSKNLPHDCKEQRRFLGGRFGVVGCGAFRLDFEGGLGGEAGARQPNPRECRGFSHIGK
jgi:hypothetical protein